MPDEVTPPRKQLVLILGAVLLAVLGFLGIVFLRQRETSEVSTSVAVPPPSKTPLALSLESPTADSLVTEGTVNVRGITMPNSSVALFTENSENFIESDQDGKFEGEVELSGGVNTLTVTVFSEDGEEKSQTFNLVYDDQVLGVKTAPGVVGSVETTTSNSVTIKEKKENKNTEAVIDNATQIINQDNKKIKIEAVKKDDIAAVVAGESGKVKKMYILEAAASAQLKRKAVSGIVTGVSGNMVTLTHQIQVNRIYQVYFTPRTIIKSKSALLSSSDLAIGLKVSAVGDLDETGRLVAKMIHVIPGKAPNLSPSL